MRGRQKCSILLAWPDACNEELPASTLTADEGPGQLREVRNESHYYIPGCCMVPNRALLAYARTAWLWGIARGTYRQGQGFEISTPDLPCSWPSASRNLPGAGPHWAVNRVRLSGPSTGNSSVCTNAGRATMTALTVHH